MSLSHELFAQVQWHRVALYLILGPVLVGQICTYIKLRHGMASGYTRKLNHLGIMLVTGPLLAVLPDSQLLVSILVTTVLQVALYTVAAYSPRPMLHALAVHSLRERDAPRARFFFLMPMITTNVALVLAALLFPMDLVKVAFFTVAVADGLAEPVGLKLGRNNTYHVRDVIWGTVNTKSVAGSLTVSVCAFGVAMLLLSTSQPISQSLLAVCAIYALLSTALEALSPRGMDNMILMLLCPLLLLALQQIFGMGS